MAKSTLIIPPFSEEDVRRFWNFVDVRGPDECWLWKGSTQISKKRPQALKYGKFSIRKTTFLAHRIAYIVQIGPLSSPSMLVCHSCDTPFCCNGNHLFEGTYKSNKQDSVRKGRHAFGDRHGLQAHPERAARGDRHGYYLHPEKWKFGEQHHQTKISDTTVEAIRTEYVAGGVSQTTLARKYGITQPYISKIILRQTRNKKACSL